MAFTPESKRIGAHTYKVMKLDAVRGSKAALRLAKVAAPGVEAFNAADPMGTEKAFAAIVAQLDEKDFDYLRELLSSVTEVSGGDYGERSPSLESVFSVHFVDRYNELVGWLAFAVMVNFRSFFSGIGELLGGSGSASSSKTQGSTGSSGASS